MKKIIIITAMFMAMNTWSADYQVTDTVSTDTASKVCAITLKGKRQSVESEILKYSCVKGDILYLTELQRIGMTQHTVSMNAARVCEMGANIHIFSLQFIVTASCIYSGKILPIVGDKKTLRMGDLAPPKKKK